MLFSIILQLERTYKKNGVIKMKKGLVAIGLGVLMLSCTNKELVQYNTDRLDNIEAYLEENKFIRSSENVEKLKNEGMIEYSREYRSLEKEADAWLEEQN